MRVVFLDFDGVIVTTRSRWARVTPDGMDPVAITWLHELTIMAEAQVVISSAWREGRSRESMLDLLKNNGWGLSPLHEDWATKLLGVNRQKEIDEWLERHPEVENWLILDDGIGLKDDPEHFIRTDCDEGVSFKNMLQACRLLGIDLSAWASLCDVKLTTEELN